MPTNNHSIWETFDLHLVVDSDHDYCISNGDAIAIDTGSSGWNSNYFLGADASNYGLFAYDQEIGNEETFIVYKLDGQYRMSQ